MNDIPDDELDSTRAALAPTLQVAADVLPLIAKAREPRFPPELAARWTETGRQLAAAWSDRYGAGAAQMRPAVFALLAIAVELGDSDCLRLAEALASATDLLEDPGRTEDFRLIAAISAAAECLAEPDGLEHPAFSDRSRHLSDRLEQSLNPPAKGLRNPTLDAIFVGEAEEQLAAMRDAIEMLPPDAYAIKTAADTIAALAEPLELFDIIDRARLVALRIVPSHGALIDLDTPAVRVDLVQRIDLLSAAIAEIAVSLPDERSSAPIVFPPPDRPPRS